MRVLSVRSDHVGQCAAREQPASRQGYKDIDDASCPVHHYHKDGPMRFFEPTREAERKGLVRETVSGKALDRAMEIVRRLSSFTPESVACIKRLVHNATETPLAQGLALERNLFLNLCITEPALARMRSMKSRTSPRRRALWWSSKEYES